MGNEAYTDSERMTKLETQLENVVLVVTRMDAKMDTWQQNFVSKELMEEKLRARDREIERLNIEQQRMEKEKAQKEDIERLEREKSSYKNNLPFWVAVVISTISLVYSFWPNK